MGGYKGYAEYRESGVEWIGEIPIHWDILKIKHLSLVRRGASPRPIEDPKYFDDEGEYAWVRIADVTASGTYLYSTPQTMSSLGSSLSVKLEKNQLFLSIAGTVGKPCINKIKACIHDGFVYFPELKIPNKFLYYIFKAEQAYKGLGKMGTQLNLNTETVGDIQISIPKERMEIIEIIDFLDSETAKIDKLISKQERLIELLQEKRLSLTLSGDGSCEDWIEERLENLVNVIRRPVRQKPDEEYVSLGLYNRGRGLFHKEPREKSEMGESDFFWVEEGDLIISGQFAWEGSVALASDRETNTVVSHRYPILRGKEGLALTEYIYSLLTTSYGDFLLNENSRGAAGRNRPLNTQSLLKEKVKVPPMPLQRKIADLVHKEEQVKSKALKLRKALQERRTALISAAVTGKIDVREVELS